MFLKSGLHVQAYRIPYQGRLLHYPNLLYFVILNLVNNHSVNFVFTKTTYAFVVNNYVPVYYSLSYFAMQSWYFLKDCGV